MTGEDVTLGLSGDKRRLAAHASDHDVQLSYQWR